MKQLKLFHLFTGLLAFLLVITTITGLYLPSPAATTPASPGITLLLMAALVNLLTGAFLERQHNNLPWLQIIGSILLLSALAAATCFAYNNSLMMSGITLDQIALFSASTGTLFHVLARLNRLFSPQTHCFDSQDRETGAVKWFNVTKGFGFITRDDGEDIFVHYRAIRGDGHRTLNEGQRVEFTVVEKDKGLQAEDVIAAPKWK